MIGVYRILHMPSGRVYVGGSTRVERRMVDHKRRLKVGNHQNKDLLSAWLQDGEDAFRFDLLEECSMDDLVLREQVWIDKLSATDRAKGFNLLKKAAHPFTRDDPEAGRARMSRAHSGRKHTEETKRRIADANLGHIVSETSKAKVAAARRGTKMSDAARAKMSEAHKNRPPRSEETRRKLSEALKGKLKNKEHIEKIAAKKRSLYLGKVTEAIYLHLQGYSSGALGRRYGTCGDTISNTFKRVGYHYKLSGQKPE